MNRRIADILGASRDLADSGRAQHPRWPASAGQRGQSLVAIFVIVGLIAFGPMILRWWLGTVQAHGLDVAQVKCEWNQDRVRYETTVVVYNTEKVYKYMLAHIRMRFRPPLGKRWPDQTTRQLYQVASKPLQVVFEPDGNVEDKMFVSVPEHLEGYVCSAAVEVHGQQRYKARPSIKEAEAAPEQIKKQWLFRLRQRLANK